MLNKGSNLRFATNNSLPMGISRFWLEIRRSRIYDIIVVFRVQGSGNFPYVFHVKEAGFPNIFLANRWGISQYLFSRQVGDFPDISPMRIVGYFPMRFNDAVWVAMCIFSMV